MPSSTMITPANAIQPTQADIAVGWTWYGFSGSATSAVSCGLVCDMAGLPSTESSVPAFAASAARASSGEDEAGQAGR
jgi:hypothetical protein